ncbi:transposase family protein [Streptomyces sp. NPDC006450]|uniref:transposase family protein n=1 Tax=Streptomyces sp. NPDC006450 TaxID=3155458 RepID=UPI0033AB542E
MLTGRLAARRGGIGTRWRRLTANRQALLALPHLRCGDTYAQFAAGFCIGVATVYRYIREAVDALAALAPTLAKATDIARTKAFVILDGTLPPIDRIAADTPYCSGKHERHGMNVQVQRRHKSTHAEIRCLGELAMATLKGWRLLRKLRCSTNRITAIVQAALVLHHASA